MQCTDEPCMCSLGAEPRQDCFPTRVLAYYDIAQAIDDASWFQG